MSFVFSNSNALPNILLGVTNPFFSKALKHWPHIVKLGDASLAGLASVSGGHMGKSPSHKIKPKFKLDSKPGVYSQVAHHSIASPWACKRSLNLIS